jgi:hypothetical protein
MITDLRVPQGIAEEIFLHLSDLSNLPLSPQITKDEQR